MVYLVCFLVGFGLSIAGGISIILYLNFIPAGLGFLDYIAVIQTRIECYFFFIGLICMGYAVHKLPTLSVK